MRIVVYSHYFTPEIGAPSARIFDFSKEWIEAGHEVEVVTCFPNHPVGKLYEGYKGGLYMHERLSGIEVHRHWTYVTPNKGFVKKTLGHVSFIPGAILGSNPHLKRPDVADRPQNYGGQVFRTYPGETTAKTVSSRLNKRQKGLTPVRCNAPTGQAG